MKIVTRTKCRTVYAKKPEDFDEKFNEATEELGHVELEWDGNNTVHMLYEETVKISETAREEYEEIKNEHYYCMNCPHFVLGKNKRCSSKGCGLNVDANAKDYTRACELFYEELAAGKITPRR